MGRALHAAVVVVDGSRMEDIVPTSASVVVKVRRRVVNNFHVMLTELYLGMGSESAE